MFIEFSEECQKTLLVAKKEMIAFKHPYVGSEHFILAILKDSNSLLSMELSKQGIDYNSFYQKLISLIGYGTESNNWFIFTPLFKRVIENAILDAKDRNSRLITTDDLFMSLLDEGEGIGVRILISLGLTIDKFLNDYSSNIRDIKKNKTKHSSLEEYGVDLVKQAKKGELDPVIGREKEIDQVIEILLRRKKNNPLLIGAAGVGKTAIVEELARRIANNEVPSLLKNKKIISLSMASLVSGTKYRGEFEERINRLIKDVKKNNNCILFIDEIHTLMGAGGAEGAIDASNILKPALSRGGFSLIGATTENEYRQHIYRDKALERRFQTITVKETSSDKTGDILKKIKGIYENYYGLEISDTILEQIVFLTNQYIHKNKQPDKSIEILDSACCHALLNKSMLDKKIIKTKTRLEACKSLKKNSVLKNDFDNAMEALEEEKALERQVNVLLKKKKNKKRKKLVMQDVVDVIEKKTNTTIYSYKNAKTSLYNILSKSIIGQDNILKGLVLSTQKHMLKKSKRTPLSFLFVGPSGVGKTYTAEVYSKVLYGDNEIIRLDMSEYREENSVNKILGSPPGYVGYNDGYSVLNKIQENPNTVLLLDEIEKAHPAVLNLFLQILDYGKIKDSSGEEVYLNNITIIMTSNIGLNNSSIGFHTNKDEKVINKLKEILNIEFVNRISEVLIFDSLKEQDILKIIDIKLKNEIDAYRGHINVKKISLNKKKKILRQSNYKEFGARQLDKLIEKEILEDIVLNSCVGVPD